MTPQPKHTPGPWQQGNGIYRYTLARVYAPFVEAKPGTLLVVASCDETTLLPTEERQANAAFIVRACNSHAALLAAANAALTDWHSHPRNITRKEPPYLALLRAAIEATEKEA